MIALQPIKKIKLENYQTRWIGLGDGLPIATQKQTKCQNCLPTTGKAKGIPG